VDARDEPTRRRQPDAHRRLERVGAVLVVAVAGLHLAHPDHGFVALSALLLTRPAGLLADPRPVAFVGSGAALLVGLALSRNAPDRRPYYLAGALVAAASLAAFLAWHLTGHGGFLPGREPLYHGVSPVENVLTHLAAPWAGAAAAAELAAAVVLAVLFRRG
jgi:hypothetical protein